jgi:DNA-binding transcriptional LysR family regulator
MDLLAALGIFTRVVETGSFSAVAREAGTSQSAVTRQIAQLETHFGVRLLHRTTRRLSLTDDGQSLLGHARQLLDYATGMESELGRHSGTVDGLVRVGTSVAGGLFLANRIPRLLEEHPALRVELLMHDQVGDVVEERLDLVLHAGEVADSALLSRRIGTFGRFAVASPAYLEMRGTPSQPSDLAGHVCLIHNSGPDSAVWRFHGPAGATSVRVNSAFLANNSQAVQVVARNGHGIALLPQVQVLDDVRSGRLIRLLSDYPSEEVPVQILYPTRRHLPPRTRVVMEFLVQEIRVGTAFAERVGAGIVDAFWA